MNRPLNFDRLAPLYRWMEWATFGPFLARARRAFLADTEQAKRALILGDGDGRFTVRLLRSNPHVQVDALDISPAMLAALLRRAGPHRPRIRTLAADLRAVPADALQGPYDLVVTHFFLDCLSTAHIEALTQALRPHLAPNALWIVSEFATPATWFGRHVAHPLVSVLYWAFGLLTGLPIRRLPDYSQALQHAGFTRLRQKPWLQGLLVSEIWSINVTKVLKYPY